MYRGFKVNSLPVFKVNTADLRIITAYEVTETEKVIYFVRLICTGRLTLSLCAAEGRIRKWCTTQLKTPSLFSFFAHQTFVVYTQVRYKTTEERSIVKSLIYIHKLNITALYTSIANAFSFYSW